MLQDSTSTSGFDSSDEEPSSGYQTSHILSPQIVSIKSATTFKVTNLKVVLHCRDLYRNHLLICPIQAQAAITQAGQEPCKLVGSVDINEMKYYAQGHFYQVSSIIYRVVFFIFLIVSDNKQVQHAAKYPEAR